MSDTEARKQVMSPIVENFVALQADFQKQLAALRQLTDNWQLDKDPLSAPGNKPDNLYEGNDDRTVLIDKNLVPRAVQLDVAVDLKAQDTVGPNEESRQATVDKPPSVKDNNVIEESRQVTVNELPLIKDDSVIKLIGAPVVSGNRDEKVSVDLAEEEAPSRQEDLVKQSTDSEREVKETLESDKTFEDGSKKLESEEKKLELEEKDNGKSNSIESGTPSLLTRVKVDSEANTSSLKENVERTNVGVEIAETKIKETLPEESPVSSQNLDPDRKTLELNRNLSAIEKTETSSLSTQNSAQNNVQESDLASQKESQGKASLRVTITSPKVIEILSQPSQSQATSEQGSTTTQEMPQVQSKESVSQSTSSEATKANTDSTAEVLEKLPSPSITSADRSPIDQSVEALQKVPQKSGDVQTAAVEALISAVKSLPEQLLGPFMSAMQMLSPRRSNDKSKIVSEMPEGTIEKIGETLASFDRVDAGADEDDARLRAEAEASRSKVAEETKESANAASETTAAVIKKLQQLETVRTSENSGVSQTNAKEGTMADTKFDGNEAPGDLDTKVTPLERETKGMFGNDAAKVSLQRCSEVADNDNRTPGGSDQGKVPVARQTAGEADLSRANHDLETIQDDREIGEKSSAKEVGSSSVNHSEETRANNANESLATKSLTRRSEIIETQSLANEISSSFPRDSEASVRESFSMQMLQTCSLTETDSSADNRVKLIDAGLTDNVTAAGIEPRDELINLTPLSLVPAAKSSIRCESFKIETQEKESSKIYEASVDPGIQGSEIILAEGSKNLDDSNEIFKDARNEIGEISVESKLVSEISGGREIIADAANKYSNSQEVSGDPENGASEIPIDSETISLEIKDFKTITNVISEDSKVNEEVPNDSKVNIEKVALGISEDRKDSAHRASKNSGIVNLDPSEVPKGSKPLLEPIVLKTTEVTGGSKILANEISKDSEGPIDYKPTPEISKSTEIIAPKISNDSENPVVSKPNSEISKSPEIASPKISKDSESPIDSKSTSEISKSIEIIAPKISNDSENSVDSKPNCEIVESTETIPPKISKDSESPPNSKPTSEFSESSKMIAPKISKDSQILEKIFQNSEPLLQKTPLNSEVLETSENSKIISHEFSKDSQDPEKISERSEPLTKENSLISEAPEVPQSLKMISHEISKPSEAPEAIAKNSEAPVQKISIHFKPISEPSENKNSNNSEILDKTSDLKPSTSETSNDPNSSIQETLKGLKPQTEISNEPKISHEASKAPLHVSEKVEQPITVSCHIPESSDKIDTRPITSVSKSLVPEEHPARINGELEATDDRQSTTISDRINKVTKDSLIEAKSGSSVLANQNSTAAEETVESKNNGKIESRSIPDNEKIPNNIDMNKASEVPKASIADTESTNLTISSDPPPSESRTSVAESTVNKVNSMDANKIPECTIDNEVTETPHGSSRTETVVEVSSVDTIPQSSESMPESFHKSSGMISEDSGSKADLMARDPTEAEENKIREKKEDLSLPKGDSRLSAVVDSNENKLDFELTASVKEVEVASMEIVNDIQPGIPEIIEINITESPMVAVKDCAPMKDSEEVSQSEIKEIDDGNSIELKVEDAINENNTLETSKESTEKFESNSVDLNGVDRNINLVVLVKERSKSPGKKIGRRRSPVKVIKKPTSVPRKNFGKSNPKTIAKTKEAVEITRRSILSNQTIAKKEPVAKTVSKTTKASTASSITNKPRSLTTVTSQKPNSKGSQSSRAKTTSEKRSTILKTLSKGCEQIKKSIIPAQSKAKSKEANNEETAKRKETMSRTRSFLSRIPVFTGRRPQQQPSKSSQPPQSPSAGSLNNARKPASGQQVAGRTGSSENASKTEAPRKIDPDRINKDLTDEKVNAARVATLGSARNRVNGQADKTAADKMAEVGEPGDSEEISEEELEENSDIDTSSDFESATESEVSSTDKQLSDHTLDSMEELTDAEIMLQETINAIKAKISDSEFEDSESEYVSNGESGETDSSEARVDLRESSSLEEDSSLEEEEQVEGAEVDVTSEEDETLRADDIVKGSKPLAVQSQVQPKATRKVIKMQNNVSKSPGIVHPPKDHLPTKAEERSISETMHQKTDAPKSELIEKSTKSKKVESNESTRKEQSKVDSKPGAAKVAKRVSDKRIKVTRRASTAGDRGLDQGGAPKKRFSLVASCIRRFEGEENTEREYVESRSGQVKAGSPKTEREVSKRQLSKSLSALDADRPMSTNSSKCRVHKTGNARFFTFPYPKYFNPLLTALSKPIVVLSVYHF